MSLGNSDSKFSSHVEGRQKLFLEYLKTIVTLKAEIDGIKVVAGGMD